MLFTMLSFYYFRSVLDTIQELSDGDENSFKVDRVLFVASATSISKEFPTELIRAVKAQTMDGRRGISTKAK